jgi:hypothetical protein
VVDLNNLTAFSLAVPHFAAVAIVAAVAGWEFGVKPAIPAATKVKATADPAIFISGFMYSG